MSEHQQILEMLANGVAAQDRTTEAVIRLTEAIANRFAPPVIAQAGEAAVAAIAEAKKPGRPRKADTAPVATATTETATLPDPAPAPATVTSATIDDDRAVLLALVGKVADGRNVARELIRAQGHAKLDELMADQRAAVLSKMREIAAAEAPL
jgi:hypothetical protein